MKPQPLRVLIVGLNYAPEPTGIAPYTSGLAEGLTAAGHEVRVLTGYPHYPEWKLRDGYKGWQRTETVNGVSVKRLRHRIPKVPNTLSRVHMELSFGLRVFFVRWGSPDVVLVVSPSLLASALAILRVRARPNRSAIGIWVQDLYGRGVVETGGDGRLAKVAAVVEALILKSTDGVVAIHERFRSHIVDSLGVHHSRVNVIRNWTHLEKAPTTGLEATRARLGWSEKDIIVLHAGNMGKKQGLENVVLAARLAQEAGSSVKFVLMGDGNQRRALELMAVGVENLSFIPPLPGDEFIKALAVADILLVHELQGLRDMAVPSKLTSYFNSGRPIVAATDADSVTAMEIAASKAGVRVEPADPAALLSAIDRLACDKDEAHRLGQSGLRYRNETLSEDAAIARYDEFLSKLASLRGR